jgi:C-terminal processing protease CtpA/Prc
MYAQYRPRVTATTTEPELFFIMYEMLESFDDGHIGIEASDEIEEAAYELYDAAHSEETEEETAIPTKPLRGYQVAAAVAEVYIPEGKLMNSGNMRWGMLKNNVGYVQLNQMMGLVDLNLPDTVSYRTYWTTYFERDGDTGIETPGEVESINAMLDVIMDELKDTEALVIDVRFNGGGKDEVGMAFLERLNPEEKVVFTKKGRKGSGFTPDNQVVQKGSATAYSKPVYLLISGESASATEIMALSSLSIPSIMRIGSRTEGVFSDILDKELPNGWAFGLSSEVYLDMKGNNYEGLGIGPDVEMNYARDTQEFYRQVMADLEKQSDRSIERAIEEAAH